ncbi:hypothetical protein QBC33DRAFT_528030 [Phialemonium atrogriseum]|uniref:NTF2 domain-containing protein n=1 Tax=Phialemonium atrogriseum TaxID=1093897 RepID=A0AAJ0C5P4_9PEZI|nr:uncharacterized protein QBC33DRAFT_528030 [Phialemonium atrogriseum]KAK1770440.1 hypothetical protein QBC33DRAFT_528030 [Phialemonium atrogriseum]
MAVSRENQVKAATEGAATFVDWYYRTLQEGNPIGPFYVTNNAKYAAASAASDISINGAVLAGGPAEYEKLLEQQRTTPVGLIPANKIQYDVEGWDVHVLNPSFSLACPAELQGAATGQESLLLQVTGHVSYGADKDAPKTPFNETFVLVPNWDALRRNAPRNMRRKLILSQNFRAL